MFDAQRFLDDAGIEYETRGRNVGSEWIAVRCPFCDDPSAHGAFHKKSGRYNCWRCGPHRIVDAIAKLTGTSPQQAGATFKKYSSSHTMTSIFAFGPRNSTNTAAPRKKLNIERHRLSKRAARYLRERGFNPVELVQQWGIFDGGVVGRNKFRIVIPVWNQGGELVSYTTRDYTGKAELRYKACTPADEVEPIKNQLYGHHWVTGNSVFLVEGPFDAWRVGRGSAVATFGTSLTAVQLRKLAQFDNVHLMFDADADVAQLRCSLELLGVRVCVHSLPDGRDPAELTQQEIEELKQECSNA